MTTDPMLFRADGEVRSIDEATRTVLFCVSTERVDSYGTILRQDWDLEQYRRNPIVFWNHNREYPIGTAEAFVTETEIAPGQIERELMARVAFDPEDAQAVRIYGLVKRKVVRGASVGFRAKFTTYLEADGGCIPVYSGNKLCELSICGLPSNDDSLARAAALSQQEKNMAEKPPTQEAPSASSSPSPETITRADHEGILRDARNTHDASIRAMQLTVDAATTKAAGAEARAAAAEKRIKDLDEDRLVRKLDSFVGKKIAPAEREVMLETIRMSESLFDRQMAGRPDIVGPPMIGSDDTTNARTSSASDSAAVKGAFEREVAKFVGQGMKRNDALAAATRTLSAQHNEAPLWPLPPCSMRPVGASRIRSRPRLRWPSCRARSSSPVRMTIRSPARPPRARPRSWASRSRTCSRPTRGRPSASRSRFFSPARSFR